MWSIRQLRAMRLHFILQGGASVIDSDLDPFMFFFLLKTDIVQLYVPPLDVNKKINAYIANVRH